MITILFFFYYLTLGLLLLRNWRVIIRNSTVHESLIMISMEEILVITQIQILVLSNMGSVGLM